MTTVGADESIENYTPTTRKTNVHAYASVRVDDNAGTAARGELHIRIVGTGRKELM